MVAKLGSSNKQLKRQVENLRSLSKDGYKKPNQRPFDFTRFALFTTQFGLLVKPCCGSLFINSLFSVAFESD